MSQPKIKTALFALATLGLAAGVASSVEARTVSADTFFATYNEMKRYCQRYDFDLWRTNRYYGCGPARCEAKSHKCQSRYVPRRPRPNCPPTIACVPGKTNDDRGGGIGGMDGGRTGGGPNDPGRDAPK